MRAALLFGLVSATATAHLAAAQGLGDSAFRGYSRAAPWYADAATRTDAPDPEASPPQLFFGSGSRLGFNAARRDAAFQSDPARPRGQGLALDLAPAEGAFVGYRFDRWTFTSGVRQRSDAPQSMAGSRLDLGASYGFNPSPRHFVSLAGRLTVGSPRTPGLPVGVYAADGLTQAGLYAGEPGLGLRLSWTYSPGERLFVDTSLGFGRLQAGGDGGPGFERSTTTFGTTFGYRW